MEELRLAAQAGQQAGQAGEAFRTKMVVVEEEGTSAEGAGQVDLTQTRLLLKAAVAVAARAT